MEKENIIREIEDCMYRCDAVQLAEFTSKLLEVTTVEDASKSLAD